jgi:ABC-type branched-subunit amino acid transport system ATPase component
MFGGLRAVRELDLEVPDGKTLRLVMGISGVVTVLDYGKKIAESPP